MKPLIRLSVAVAVMTIGLAQAQGPDPWIGKRVFTQYGAVLKVGDVVVDDEKRTDDMAIFGKERCVRKTYRVEHVNGEWLWLKDEKSGIAGWVQSKWVVPYDQAIDFFTNWVRTDPSSKNYRARGAIWADKGEYDIAIADYNEAIRLDPSNKAAYCCRGNAWSDKKEYDRAIADYNEAIRLEPKFALAYYDRGDAWSHKNDHDRAIADYNEAIRLEPKFAFAYNNRGSARVQKKEYDSALADYTEAIRLDPKDATAYLNRGITWSHKKDYNRALSDYNEAIRLDPKAPGNYHVQAWYLATCPDPMFRDAKKAVESATKACELTNWKDDTCLDTLATGQAEAGEFDLAVKWEEAAIKLTPGTEGEMLKWRKERLALYRDKKPYHQP